MECSQQQHAHAGNQGQNVLEYTLIIYIVAVLWHCSKLLSIFQWLHFKTNYGSTVQSPEKVDPLKRKGGSRSLHTVTFCIAFNIKLIKFTATLDQTLSIWLGIQFRQRYGQIKDRRPK